MRHTLTVRNVIQKVLFEQEIAGQISDGHWENALPHDHWHAWSGVIVWVARADRPTPLGRNFLASRRYNVLSRELVAVVGKRMLAYARLARAFGPEMVEPLSGALDLEGEWRGTPGPELTGEYWDGIRKTLAAVNLEAVKKVVEDETYGMAELRSDLRELGEAMNNYLDEAAARPTVATPQA